VPGFVFIAGRECNGRVVSRWVPVENPPSKNDDHHNEGFDVHCTSCDSTDRARTSIRREGVRDGIPAGAQHRSLHRSLHLLRTLEVERIVMEAS
jgi:hypothetical protein